MNGWYNRDCRTSLFILLWLVVQSSQARQATKSLQNSVEDVLNNYRHKQYAIDSRYDDDE
jgi:hypothetical protein